MKKVFCVVALSLLAYSSVIAESLSIEDQTRIVTAYGIATGQVQSAVPAHVDTGRPPDKCGTSVVNEFWQYRDRIDPALMSALGVQLLGRPDSLVLPRSYGSPAGRFLVHYVDTGANAVYQPQVRTLVDTVPNYVVMIARIADSVYSHIIDTLGYPIPPADDFYPTGLDDRFDIYLQDLSAQFYGLTYLDVQVTSTSATSYLVLDNDYQSIEKYVSRPLDAARVTVAHEYFHAVQFGMDFTEYDGYPSPTRKQYWMEMSAVWMEEEVYDAINDYYAYLPYVFDHPTISLQSFGSVESDLHPYGAAVFAMYLSQKWGRDIIRNIWFGCRDRGAGSDFLKVCEAEVRAVDPPDGSLATALNEYSIWNYFTGQYASVAPDGMGYEEAAAYPVIPIDKMSSVNGYPALEFIDSIGFRPEYNGTSYLLFNNLDTRYLCLIDSSGTGVYVPCDSVMAITVGYRSTFNSTEPTILGVSVIYQLAAISDSIEINKFEIPIATTTAYQFIAISAYHPNRYKSIAVAFSPTTSEAGFYPRHPLFGYAIADSGGLIPDRPSAVLTPYPNPAVTSSMAGQLLTFRFQVASDTTNSNVTNNPLLLIDIYTVAGEFVKTINATFGGEDRLGVHSEGIYETGWDMRNSSGKGVASGVYLAYARLWDTPEKKKLLAESKSKVALIR